MEQNIGYGTESHGISVGERSSCKRFERDRKLGGGTEDSQVHFRSAGTALLLADFGGAIQGKESFYGDFQKFTP